MGCWIYDDIEYDDYVNSDECRYEIMDRAYDEAMDELLEVSTKEQAIEFAKRYPVLKCKVEHILNMEEE